MKKLIYTLALVGMFSTSAMAMNSDSGTYERRVETGNHTTVYVYSSDSNQLIRVYSEDNL